METTNSNSAVSKGAFWGGWALSVLPCLLMTMSAVMKFVQPAGFDEGLKHMGWDATTMKYIGVVELICVAVYLFPRTTVLGAILITGYMGGAIATHVRVGDQFVAPALVGILVWLGLWLRETKLKPLLPIMR